MPKNLLDAVNALLSARENHMLTSAEWDALLAAAMQANQAAGATYASYSVDVTYADGREPHREFKTEAIARQYYDQMVADKQTTRVLLFGYEADGNMEGIDGWWAD
jgi:hypothetical protein